jgi:hypothetical protein
MDEAYYRKKANIKEQIPDSLAEQFAMLDAIGGTNLGDCDDEQLMLYRELLRRLLRGLLEETKEKPPFL